MRYDAFLTDVRNRLGEHERGMAEPAVAATLGALGESLPEDGRSELAAQLPNTLKVHFSTRRQDGLDTPELFLARVAELMNIAPQAAEPLVNAVMAALRDAVSEGALRNALSLLPPGFNRIMGLESQGPARRAMPRG